MAFREYARYFYLKYMKILQHRNRVRMLKTALGGTFYTLGAGVTWYQSMKFMDERKSQQTGIDSFAAAGILAQVSGFGENKLSKGKSLDDLVSEMEQKTRNYQHIPGPRPWEMQSPEEKEKYLKRAYAQVEKNLIDQKTREEEEEERIEQEIENIRKKLKDRNK